MNALCEFFQKLSIVFVDGEGHLVKESYVDLGNQDYSHEWIYTYDANGHRTKKDYSSQTLDGYYEYTLYEYNNAGKFVAMEWFMMGPEISDAVDGICKDLSRSLRVIEYPFSSKCTETTYTFNSDGNLVIRESTYEISEGSEERENEVAYEYTIVYENGYPKSLDSDKLRYKIVDITWYPNGMYKDFVYKEENAYNFDTGWDVHTYKMLDNPRYLAVESFDLGGRASTISLTPKWMRKSYDAHFDIVKNEEGYGEEAYTEGAEPTYTDTWTEYTYDKYGNWVTRVESVIARWTGQQGKSTITREIEYFD